MFPISGRGLFLLTERRERRLRHLALDLLCYMSRHRRKVPVRRLASIAGLAQSSSLAVPLARCWLRSLYDDISQAPGGWHGVSGLVPEDLSVVARQCALQALRFAAAQVVIHR